MKDRLSILDCAIKAKAVDPEAGTIVDIAKDLEGYINSGRKNDVVDIIGKKITSLKSDISIEKSANYPDLPLISAWSSVVKTLSKLLDEINNS